MVRPASSETGAAIVEFALGSVALFMLVFGILDLTRAVYAYNALASGARRLAYYASIHCVYESSNYYNLSQLYSLFESQGWTLSMNRISITANPPSGAQCDYPKTPVSVQVTYSFEPVTPFISEIVPNGISIESSATIDSG